MTVSDLIAELLKAPADAIVLTDAMEMDLTTVKVCRVVYVVASSEEDRETDAWFLGEFEESQLGRTGAPAFFIGEGRHLARV